MGKIIKKEKQVSIHWVDAVIYSRPVLRALQLKPTHMMTKGILVKKDSAGVYIKDPYSIYQKTKKQSVRECGDHVPTFLFIPYGMITSLEE